MKKIADYEILDHGIEHSQYFQGCGTSFTEFTDVATGIGSCFSEALEDALESLSQNDWDTSTIESDGHSEPLPGDESVPDDAEDCYYHVSVRVR